MSHRISYSTPKACSRRVVVAVAMTFAPPPLADTDADHEALVRLTHEIDPLPLLVN